MKYLLVLTTILIGILAHTQTYSLEYIEKRPSVFPERLKDKPADLVKKVKEIITDSNNRIYLNKVFVSPECISSRIDSVYYEDDYVKNDKIRTDYVFQDYFYQNNKVYISDPRFEPDIFELTPNDLNIKEYPSIQKVIGHYQCHKVVVPYRSVNYEVWVTDSPKTKGGPMVFSILPYLVVEVNSDKRTYRLLNVKEMHGSKDPFLVDVNHAKPFAKYEQKLASLRH